MGFLVLLAKPKRLNAHENLENRKKGDVPIV